MPILSTLEQEWKIMFLLIAGGRPGNPSWAIRPASHWVGSHCWGQCFGYVKCRTTWIRRVSHNFRVCHRQLAPPGKTERTAKSYGKRPNSRKTLRDVLSTLPLCQWMPIYTVSFLSKTCILRDFGGWHFAHCGAGISLMKSCGKKLMIVGIVTWEIMV